VLNEHPAVRKSFAMPYDDARAGRRLVAYVNTLEAIGSTELRNFLQSRLPAHMIPAQIVPLDHLPLAPDGSLDHARLPAPAQFEIGNRTGARDPLEEVVAGVWAEVLGVAEVGVDENFFELGGHSLMAVRIVGRLERALKVRVALRSLFERPTVAGLVEVVRGQGGEELGPIRRQKRQIAPLTHNQRRLWFQDQLVPGNSFYNSCGTVQLSGRLEVEALRRALSQIVERHEILRTSFRVIEGEPQQVIGPVVELRIPLVDLSELGEREREREARRLATEAWRSPFELAAGELLRVSVLRLSEQEHALVASMHHIVGDAWSMSVLTRELQLLYEAYAGGRESPLAPLAIQYADYAVWQQEWLGGAALEEQLGYWKRQLRGCPAQLQLPTDRARPAVQSHRGSYLEFELEGELAGAVRGVSRREGVSLFMTLLAGFQALLQRYSGADDVVVGVGMANRPQVETEELIGCFVNMLVLRTDLSGSPTFRQLLERVREVTLEAYAHQMAPFEKVVEAVQPVRDLSYTPLFQVAFGVDNAPKQKLELQGLNQSALPFDYEAVRYDLSLWVVEQDAGLKAYWTYSTDLFEERTIARMHHHYETLLRHAMAQPETPLDLLRMQSEEEERREQVRRELRDTENQKKLISVRPKAVSLRSN
jgi:acyl carrier protein